MAQYHVTFAPSADKALRKLPHSIQIRIATAVDALLSDPRPRGSVKLKGEADLWRIRVGDYRVVYTIEDDKLLVLVVRVAHRKDVYRS
jgi:mRNA interferase RelE/StbE